MQPAGTKKLALDGPAAPCYGEGSKGDDAMATTPEYREHVYALLEGLGTVRTRKMFGEYLL